MFSEALPIRRTSGHCHKISENPRCQQPPLECLGIRLGCQPLEPHSEHLRCQHPNPFQPSRMFPTPDPSPAKSREELLKEEIANCQGMKISAMKTELEALGISTKSFFEKDLFVQALAEARVDRATTSPPSSSLPDFDPDDPAVSGMFDSAAKKFKDAGLSQEGVDSAMKAGKKMMGNPKVMEIIMKAQSNPALMKVMNECQDNPLAFAKYRNDPEVGEFVREMQKAKDDF